MAISADVDWLALVLVEILSNVLHARGIGNTVIVGIVVDTRWVAAVAITTSLAVNHNLRAKANWGRVEVLEENVESISKS